VNVEPRAEWLGVFCLWIFIKNSIE